MKWWAYGFYVVVMVFLGILFVNRPHATDFYKLTGFVEMVYDKGIQRINFPAKETKQVLEKGLYEVVSFDLSSNSKDRILWADKKGDFQDRIILLRDNELRVIFDEYFVRLPSFSPKNEEFAYLYGKYDRESKDWFARKSLFLANLEGSSNRKASGLPLSPYRPAWFPDGKQIAYLSKDVSDAKKEQIRAYRHITEADYLEAQKKKDPASKAIQSLATEIMYFDVYLHDLETAQTRKLTDRERNMEQGPLWSPDGKYLAYNDEGLMSHEIYIVEVATGRQEKLVGVHGELMVWREN